MKARRSLAKIKISVSNQSELEQLIAKTKARIEKAKLAIAKKSDPTPVEVPTTNEPEAKRRREDMDADERKEFDMWLDDVRNKRYGVHEGSVAGSLRQNIQFQSRKDRDLLHKLRCFLDCN